jgi:hypothetical protein
VGSTVAVALVVSVGSAVAEGVSAVSVGSVDAVGVSVASVGSTGAVGALVAAATRVGVRVGMSGSGVAVGGMVVGGDVGKLVAFCANCFSTTGYPMPNSAARISRAPTLTSGSPIQSDDLLLCTPPPHDQHDHADQYEPGARAQE